jgi:glutathione-regulated potassium-efflux system ancillary protein KefC
VNQGLLVQITVLLGAAVVFVPLAARYRLGAVLGYLVAGCVVGPFALGLVDDVQATMHIAELGVVLMLFVIGLELDPQRLWSLRRAVFGGGTVQMVSVGIVLAGAGLACGLDWRAAIVAGLSLALSSTAISVQTMAERNLTATPTGRISFAILLFQDIAAIPLIAIVPLLADDQGHGGGGGSAWLGAAKVAGAVVAVVLIGRYLTRPLMRVVAGAHLREVFTAFALVLVLGIAQLMNLAGVSMGLGAFLAGVLLASSEYRHALESDLEPFKGLLMGLFFVAVGMSIDFGLLSREPLTIVAIVIGFLLLKTVTLWLIAPRVDVGSKDRWLFAGLLAQGGEFAFVVFGVAGQAAVLPGEWGGRLTLTVALSMAATPFILLVRDKVAARRAQDRAQAYDEIGDEGAQVIVCGFGRFGQVVGRLLLASGVPTTILDQDPDQVESLRRFGFRVFYGDATRTDLLEAAGARKARLLVNAIDDVDTNLRLIDAVRHEFPTLKILSRARNLTHWLALRERGIAEPERETFEGALVMARRALEALGVRPYEARERADRFRRHNVRSVEEIRQVMRDAEQRQNMAKLAREELERLMEQDRAQLDRELGTGWGEGTGRVHDLADAAGARGPSGAAPSAAANGGGGDVRRGES